MTALRRPRRTHRTTRALVASAALVAVLAACSSAGEAAAPDDSAVTEGAGDAEAPELRLGYFANITHATPLVGVADGTFAEALGDTELRTDIFNAGPAAVEALFSGGLDATYIGPNPAINAFAKSDGEAIRIVGGATSGGAQLVVREGIDDVEDLRGATLATPQLGNTQDVALRAWLLEEGLETSVTGGQNDVEITPQENAQTLDLFKQGSLDGAWLPEPWASRLVLEGGAKVLLDEKELWPEGDYVTTHLIVRTEFLEQYPGTVKKLLEAQVTTNEWIAANPEEAATLANTAIGELTGKQLGEDVLARAWPNLRITNDPIASSLQLSADHAASVGVSDEVELDGIYDLSLLNAVLTERGQTAVSAAGLGTE
ncbi:ABC transporter substrate-binding protein [Cellulomonas cellasea]|uniref:Sulfonate ABC transporter substrate-binding protein n=2 Tax=Cellulomonas cellasea TaxID=43670 RepID=A0A0A0BA33_9CELL|nr:ABC transporter substrate-binding protein [Cellulomonas cellasea]KGM02156.1 sulfonate ABC transporter substrate-binding protein [Cellulomonas cellasea DSM 20118]GEA88662.1 lipoprotein [Cellulomonas cellasea]